MPTLYIASEKKEWEVWIMIIQGGFFATLRKVRWGVAIINGIIVYWNAEELYMSWDTFSPWARGISIIVSENKYTQI